MIKVEQKRTIASCVELSPQEARLVSIQYLQSLVGGEDTSINKDGDLEEEIEERGSHSSWRTVKIRKATEDDRKVFAAIDVLYRNKVS